MSGSRDCPKCGSAMVEGFVVDKGHGTATIAAWVEGEPVRSLWTGLKLRGRKLLPIATWRCRRCGFLESYAS